MDYAGKTALITGASSGIGVGYAEAFAARGSNLILVARRIDRMETLAERLRKAHGVEVDVVGFDLSVPDAGAALAAHLGARHIDFVINNAGFGVHSRFVNEDRARTQEEIRLNIATLVDLTSAYLPAMVERNSGVIVNIASTASFQPVPGMAVYGATKAFVRSFTEAVWGELRDSNVRVLAVSPGGARTEFFDVAGGEPSGKLVTVDDVVRTTFKALDAKRATPSVVVGGTNAFTAKLVQMLPKKFVIKTVAKMFLPPK